ncbi:hypothetical protein C2845_PM07G12550 [Panicum miliaceum]|uniref:Uncharacterized protein n=1 Tax=Panicum miliaceum TaxID=4540 RepID=A0A3L6SKW3_PANMI|nr:hypothetical protein C2845_PM07G12550 [Panicum miliaceum]
MAPKKQAACRGRKRGADGEGGSSSPSVKVTKTVTEGSSWRASTVKERDLLRLVAERILQEERVGDLERFRSDPPEPAFEESSRDPPAAGHACDVAAKPPCTNDSEENPETPRQGVVDLTGERSPTSGQMSPATLNPDGNSETPASASSSTIQAGTSASLLPKEPIAASTAEPSVEKDVPASTGGKDLEPPADAGAQLEKEAPGNVPRPSIEDSAQIGKQAITSTSGQHEVVEDSQTR